MECIKAVIHNKDNAIILDFFADLELQVMQLAVK